MTVLMGRRLALTMDQAEAGQPYSLKVLNENSGFQQFALFQTIPGIVGPSTDPVSLAWMIGNAAAGSPDNPSQSNFSWQITYSAVTGYIQEVGTPTNPRQFSTASNSGVQVDSYNQLAVTYSGSFPNGAPSFPTDPISGTKGVIVVKADGLIPTATQQGSEQMTINIGIAMNNKPTVAVQLVPNLTYTFTPKPTYYIIAGAFVEGAVIDTATSTDAFEIKFQGVTKRTVRFTDQNQFESVA